MLLILPAEEEVEGSCLTQRAEGTEEVAGLAAASLGAVQHAEEEAQLTGKAELLGAEMVLEGTANGLKEVQHLCGSTGEEMTMVT